MVRKGRALGIGFVKGEIFFRSRVGWGGEGCCFTVEEEAGCCEEVVMAMQGEKDRDTYTSETSEICRLPKREMAKRERNDHIEQHPKASK